MLQSDQFCLLTSTSLRLRLTCASNFDGIPYAVGSMMRPISRFDCGISSRCALAAAIPVADAAVAPAKTTPRRRNLRLACDWGELVSTTLSVADPLRDLGPRATSVFCMTVSSRLLTALFVVVFAQRGFVATAGHRLCATRCCSCQRPHRQAYSWRTKTAKQIRPMSQESKTITTWRNGAGACWRNQYSSEFVATYDEEQRRQHGIRRSMPPMAPFPQSVFR
jgi:hypothetical protein